MAWTFRRPADVQPDQAGLLVPQLIPAQPISAPPTPILFRISPYLRIPFPQIQLQRFVYAITASSVNQPGASTQLAFDDFNRVDSATLGPNWTAMTGTAGVTTNQAGPLTFDVNGQSLQRYSAISWPDDQYSQLTVVDNASASGCAGPAVRCSSVAATCYSANCNTGAGKLFKIVAGVGTQLGVFPATVAGDVVRLAIWGTRLFVYINGVVVLQVSDPTITSGSAGINCGAATARRWDNWSGGDLLPLPKIPVQVAQYLRVPFPLFESVEETWIMVPASTAAAPPLSLPFQYAPYIRGLFPVLATLKPPWLAILSQGDSPPAVQNPLAPYLRVPFPYVLQVEPETWVLVPPAVVGDQPPGTLFQPAPYLRYPYPMYEFQTFPWLPPSSLGDQPPTISQQFAPYLRPQFPVVQAEAETWILVPSGDQPPAGLLQLAPYLRVPFPVIQSLPPPWMPLSSLGDFPPIIGLIRPYSPIPAPLLQKVADAWWLAPPPIVGDNPPIALSPQSAYYRGQWWYPRQLPKEGWILLPPAVWTPSGLIIIINE